MFAGVISPSGTLQYRAGAEERLGSRSAAPGLRGYFVGGRMAAVLATEDLSAGLLNIPHDGIVGYAPEPARAILTNLLRQKNAR